MGHLVLLISLVWAFVVTIQYTQVLILRQKLPPGLFPLPVVGNCIRICGQRPWVACEQWTREYNSPMITLWRGTSPVIIINDVWTARDICESHADVFATRHVDSPPVKHTTVRYRSFQGNQAKILTMSLLTDMSDSTTAFERYADCVVSIFRSVGSAARDNDQTSKQTDQMGDIIHCGDFAEHSTFVKWLAHVVTSSMWGLFPMRSPNEGKARLDAPRIHPDGPDTEQEQIGAHYTGSTYIDGAHLNGSRKLTNALLSAVSALCLFSDAQRVAQDEIDSVVGNSRSPSWEDFDGSRLPYVSALAKEILRWQPVVTLACAPPSVRDAVFQGFLIPKGTQIACNIWAIHRNSREFPFADVLRPNRFLGTKQAGHESHYPKGVEYNAFGWGLQRCGGQALAEQSLCSVLARLLWALNIEPGLKNWNQGGQLSAFRYDGTTPQRRSVPFKVRFTPRSRRIEDLIEFEAQEAAAQLRRYKM
ncbi:hypothetical protein N0V93_000237 [Gnomoniopsis smithogilvyi]|uniref:Cytochrome P450 n=1 Tax=Gnomoniopsis smithogilvyi TaxID=1191159 RepID=A0A9W9D1J7_9PEZI|nr:hypothetical protein N0V93_000237 [Gnomoniopsis smithogilvyi]